MEKIERIFVGNYLTGLPNEYCAVENVSCDVSENDFIFYIGTKSRRELGKIPRDTINQIIIEDKSKITKRLTTVTRLAIFGPFALAMPKKKKRDEFALIIDWTDENGINHNIIFEFTGYQCQGYANLAGNKLNEYQVSKVKRLALDEKKCPFCAEIIKKEALICKFCRSKLKDE
jgi:hypothetical protein